jgi:uncharacterized protein YyaL (SSP411 family)
MTDARGGFYSAEDADSVPPELAGQPAAHKTEGAFYVWTDEEIGRVLGDDAAIARRRFGIEPGGNAPSDPHGEFTGKNLLYAAQPLEDVAIRSGCTREQVTDVLARIRRKLFEARAGRPRPHLDDKILTAWNGLMIAAFARAARTRESPRYLQAARRAAAFIRENLWNPAAKRLLRRYRDGEAAIDGYAEDYAYLIFGLLELFQADGDPAWLEWALDLQRRQDELFWDAEAGGWFSTTGADPTVLLRLKEDYDGAEPAASSVSVLNLLTIGHLLTGTDAGEKVERTLARYGPRIGGAARAIPMMLCALSAWHADHTQVVVVGPRDDERTAVLRREVARRYLPFAVVVPVDPVHQTRIAQHLPFVAAMTMHDGHPLAYVCRDFTCKSPVSGGDALAAELQ